MIESRRPPARETGLVGWLRRNLFAGPVNSLATAVVLAVVLWTLFSFVRWAVGDANWERLWVNLKLLMVYRYPSDLLWRPLLATGAMFFAFGLSGWTGDEGLRRIVRGAFWQFLGLFGILLVVAIAVGWSPTVIGGYAMAVGLGVAGYGLGRVGQAFRPARALLANIGWVWLLVLALVPLLLYGLPGVRSGPMQIVPIRAWGGFMLTLILTTGIVPSFPIGVALALGRRSDLPGISWVCIGFIELIRGAPLIVWLYIANLMVPLLFNVGPEALPALAKAYIALTMFSSAYMAENVRGGLQAVPRGQPEAARALGLSSWQTTRLIVLPQAIRAVIPAIVGQAIGLFKDTSLVFILGLLDFFNVHNVVVQQPRSILVPGGVRMELAIFLALLYFFVAYRMSVASRQLESNLGVGER